VFKIVFIDHAKKSPLGSFGVDDRFQYMAIADNRQRLMPLPDDRLPGRCQALAYPEAVILVNPKLPELTGEVLYK
jgi:hypothetical protein